MNLSPGARAYVGLTIAIVVCAAVGASGFGLVVGDWTGTAVAAGTAAVGVGAGWVFFYRGASASLERARIEGAAEGVADLVLIAVALYEAAVFPLTPGGVRGAEQEARRTTAYHLSAHDGLPCTVRVSAADALEVLDKGSDLERARAAVTALSIAVYECRDGLAPVRRGRRCL
ncbi:hypothetical protein WJM95_34555 [Streptomyces sp. f51]|uniref:hypothetical protein n=1 Tax=Streptomyces sp. f51 TaxID=1827742 RepID=UPI0030CD4FAB